jgi:uncharacterized HAD superfamily protein
MADKQKIVGFDLDDVLLDFNGTLLEWHNKKYGTKTLLKDLTVYGYEEIWQSPTEEVVRKVFEFYNSQEHAAARPMDGAIEGIQKIKKDNRLFIITSKPDTFREIMNAWIQKNFPNTFEEIYFTNQFHGIGIQTTKIDLCKKLGIEIFIDDALHNAKNIAENGIPVLLLDSPWNQATTETPITRVHSWNEIVQKLTE